MSDSTRCPECGATLPPGGLCGPCLIRLGLASDDGGAEASTRHESDEDPVAIGKYRVIRRLGEGGMGVVYLGEQTDPIRRNVAIKIIKLGMSTREVVARFEAERQTLAEMDHPGIAQVIEAGTTAEGRPYFVMEHVDGAPITEYCDRNRLKTRPRVEIFADVCDAVHHAHLRGVIHRDLKPSNVLVAEVDGRPQVKVIDFGVAKATARSLVDRSVFTELGQIVGTLEYMSPEQAELTGLDVDLRSDVYSLGVLFYELLVGTVPFESEALRRAGLEAMLRAIREQDSPRPSTRVSTLGGQAAEAARNRGTDPPSLARHLRGDLDWVVMRALEKDRARRYASASELAAEVRRYIDHQPVLAGPPGGIYRLRRFVRRHRVGVVAASIVGLVSFTLVAFYTVRLREQRNLAEGEAAKARQVVEFVKGLFEGADPRATGGVEMTVRELLERGSERLETDLDGQPEVQAEISGLLGAVHTALGDHVEARRFLEQTVTRRRELYGENDLQLAIALRDLGRLDYKQGDAAEAERKLRRALEIQLGHADTPARDVAVTRKDICAVLQRGNDQDAAMTECRAALEILESLSPAADLELVEALAVTGYGLLLRNETAQAKPYLERGLALARETLGEQHPDLGYHLDYNARLRRAEGDLEGALAAVRESWKIRRAALGERHPQTVQSQHNVALYLERTGDLDGAESMYREALTLRREILGQRHFMVSISAYSLAALLQRLQRLDDAEALFREAADIQLEVQGAGHYAYGRTLSQLGALHLRRDDAAAAEPVLRQSRSIIREALPRQHPEQVRPLLWLGWLLTLTERSAEAEPVLREALEIQRSASPDSANVAAIELALAACLARLGNTAEARTLFDACAPRLEDGAPPGSWQRHQLDSTAELIGR